MAHSSYNVTLFLYVFKRLQWCITIQSHQTGNSCPNGFSTFKSSAKKNHKKKSKVNSCILNKIDFMH